MKPMMQRCCIGRRTRKGRTTTMAWYMIQGSYTPEAWAAQIKNPTDRIAAVGQMMAPLGVTFEHYWYSFGDHDFVIIAQGPGHLEASAAVLAAYSGGALTSIKTTPLLTGDEAIAALRKASDVQYRPPSAG
jgi:uncharacterized protein with GYD domain